MKLIVNGQEYNTEASNLAELLTEMDIKTGSVAVELNLNIIKRAELKNTALSEDDNVEVVNFVGGG